MRLNLANCMFGAKEGRFLGFYIGKKGICPNPDKISEILNTSPTTTLKEVQKFNGKFNVQSHFFSKFTGKCKSFLFEGKENHVDRRV